MLIIKILSVMALLTATITFAFLVVSQGSYPADAVFTPEFNFVLTQGEKDILISAYPNLLYDIIEDGAYTSFVLNGTALDTRPDVSVKLEDYVNSQRPFYNSTGSKFDCQPTLIQGKWLMECTPL